MSVMTGFFLGFLTASLLITGPIALFTILCWVNKVP